MNIRIPADVEREDRILGSLTARQVTVLAVAGFVLYGGWLATRAFVPVLAYLVFAAAVGAVVAGMVLLHRDGLTLDRLLWAALRQRLSPRRRVAAPAGDTPELPEWFDGYTDHAADGVTAGLDLPALGVNEAGIVDLGRDGIALVAACSTVNFALRTPGEQDALVASFGRWLHSLTAPVQILIRAGRLDLSGQIAELREQAPSLPHPALETAAYDHADFLAHLDRRTQLLRRQILLVLREPAHTKPGDSMTSPVGLRFPFSRRTDTTESGEVERQAAATRLLRRAGEASALLAPAGITVTPLDASQATAVLAAACRPDNPLPPAAGLAGADEVITTPAHHDGLDGR